MQPVAAHQRKKRRQKRAACRAGSNGNEASELLPFKEEKAETEGRRHGHGTLEAARVGAELVVEDVREAYPQTALVQDAQLANARGYLNYARFIARQS